jgi:hypothetical protein
MNAFNQFVSLPGCVRSLFTSDDDCDLVLLDEMDPLECDIDIIAKPKGKRPKSIHQLVVVKNTDRNCLLLSL